MKANKIILGKRLLIVAEVIDAIDNQKSPWERMMARLANFYDKRFNGPDWREKVKRAIDNLADV